MPDALEIVCLGCGCLCDDYPVLVVNGQVVPADSTCSMAAEWLSNRQSGPVEPVATHQGQPISIDEAVDRAARILLECRSPIIHGLTQSTVEAVAEAVAIADRLGGWIERDDAAIACRSLDAERSVGLVTATWGEVRDRADLVVFWKVDPDRTHPRHGLRYSIDPIGRFVPNGRRDRTILVAGSTPNQTAHRADRFLELADDQGFAYLQALRAVVRGLPTADLPDPSLADWADPFRRAAYGVVVYDDHAADSIELETLFLLVRELNDQTRFVAIPIGGGGNAPGAASVLTWQAGDPLGADFSSGSPRPWFTANPRPSIPGIPTFDAHLYLGDKSIDEHQGCTGVSWITIGPGATGWSRPSTLALNTPSNGIDGGGTVVRSDGAWLRLEPPLPASLPTDRQWLRRIRDRLDELSS